MAGSPSASAAPEKYDPGRSGHELPERLHHLQVTVASALRPEIEEEHEAGLQHQSHAHRVERAAVAVDRGQGETDGQEADLDALVEDEAALDTPHAGGLGHLIRGGCPAQL